MAGGTKALADEGVEYGGENSQVLDGGEQGCAERDVDEQRGEFGAG